jgi:hypothetical protein
MLKTNTRPTDVDKSPYTHATAKAAAGQVLCSRLTGKVAPRTPGPYRKNEMTSSFKQTKAANATKNPNTQNSAIVDALYGF